MPKQLISAVDEMDDHCIAKMMNNLISTKVFDSNAMYVLIIYADKEISHFQKIAAPNFSSLIHHDLT